MKKILALILAMLMVVSLVACGSSAPAAPAATEAAKEEAPAATEAAKEEAPAYKPGQFKLSGGTTVADSHAYTQLLSRLAERMKEETNGAVEITVYSNAQLGNEAAMLEQIQMGSLDMEVVGLSTIGGFVPAFAVCYLPYMFSDIDVYNEAMTMGSDLTNELVNYLEKQNLGVSMLGIVNSGLRAFHANAEVNSLADIKGMSMRVPTSELDQKVWSTLGTIPTPQSFSEVYTLIESGVVDCFECTTSAFVSNSLYEVAPYFIRTDHNFSGAGLLIGNDALAKLPEEYQALLSEVVTELVAELNEEVKASEESAIQECVDKYGCTVIDVDTAEFAAQLADFYDEYTATIEGGPAILELIRAANK